MGETYQIDELHNHSCTPYLEPTFEDALTLAAELSKEDWEGIGVWNDDRELLAVAFDGETFVKWSVK